MGTSAQVVVLGPHADALAERARHRIEVLEARWSRFRSESEISRLADRSGHASIVSSDTFGLVDLAVRAWAVTGGRYDPTVGNAMLANGYDRDFSRLGTARRSASAPDRPVRPAPGCDGIHLDADLSMIMLPPGVRLDPGGIAKGWAADLVTAELLRLGADAAMVNLGGDLRVRGPGPDGGRWPVSIEDLRSPGTELLRISIDDAGLASSSTLQRRWRHRGTDRHHVIDPRTGRPAETAVVGVTVLAADAWMAEAQATAILLAPDPDAAVRELETVAAIAVSADGTLHPSPDLEELAA